MFKIQKCVQNLRLKISLKSDIILLRQKSNDFDEGDAGMNCYRIAAFVTAVAVMASVFSGCSQVAESIVSTSNTTVSDTSQTEVTAMPKYVAEYPLSPYLLLISCSDSDGVVGTYPKSYHKTLTINETEHIWNEIPGTGHDHTSVKPHLYNFCRMIFRSPLKN